MNDESDRNEQCNVTDPMSPLPNIILTSEDLKDLFIT